MAIRLRTSSAAVALLLVVCLGLMGQPVFAQGCGIDPQTTINIGTAGVPPYTPESQGDTAFLSHSVVGGPYATLDILVTRYLAPVDRATGRIPILPPASDDHHKPYVGTFPTHLENLGIVGSKATLKFAYSFREFHYLNYDKNKQQGATVESSLPMRPTHVRFNDTDVTDRLTLTVSKTTSTRDPGHVTTTLNGVLATLEMNIWEINFPTDPGENGNPPSPGVNTLVWQFEEGYIGDTEPPCLNYSWYMGGAVSWAGIEIEALAPVVLVHGIGGEAEDWTKGTDADGHLTEAESVTTYLTKEHVTYSNKINLTEHGKRDKNGTDLSAFFREAATEFGAKAIHVVAHSKGGLDARSFLQHHAADLDDAKGIHLLSLSTLSTPHHGSILADLSILERSKGRVVSDVENIQLYLNTDRKLNLLNRLPFINFGPQEPGLLDLQVKSAADFNQIAPWPESVQLFTYGASADLNAPSLPDPNYEAEITAGQPNTPNETSPMIPRIPLLLDRQKISLIATAIFRISRDYSAVRISGAREYTSLFRRRWALVYEGVPGPLNGEGDLAVTIPSSHLDGESVHRDFTGQFGVNHTSMRTARIAEAVLERVKAEFPL